MPGGLIALGIVGDSDAILKLSVICAIVVNSFGACIGALVSTVRRPSSTETKRMAYRLALLAGTITVIMVASTYVIEPVVTFVTSTGILVAFFIEQEAWLDEAMMVASVVVNGAIGAALGAIFGWVKSRLGIRILVDLLTDSCQ